MTKYLLAIATVVLLALNLLVGSVHIPLGDIVDILRGHEVANPGYRYIILESRLPQAITALLTGAALATCGLMLQTMFRNPLAGPSVFGIDSGASLGVAIVILAMGGSVITGMGTLSGLMAILISAFLGAILVMIVLLWAAERVRSNVMLLIVGIMTGYLVSSAIVLLNFFATEEGVRSYMIWGMGNFSGVPLSHLPTYTFIILICLGVALLMVKPLNQLMLGEQYAEGLGLNVRRFRIQLLMVTGILTATSTAYCGPIAFIGLAVPHIARILFHHTDHRHLLPVTMIMGSIVALLCNLVCSIPFSGSVIPLNALTPFIGAPVVIYVILKDKNQ
ncbi:MAG: iron ABC transporter permease [Prevotella sp.]|nr:iron ABC transporter permease [Prevotella sp.]